MYNYILSKEREMVLFCSFLSNVVPLIACLFMPVNAHSTVLTVAGTGTVNSRGDRDFTLTLP